MDSVVTDLTRCARNLATIWGSYFHQRYPPLTLLGLSSSQIRYAPKLGNCEELSRTRNLVFNGRVLREAYKATAPTPTIKDHQVPNVIY